MKRLPKYDRELISFVFEQKILKLKRNYIINIILGNQDEPYCNTGSRNLQMKFGKQLSVGNQTVFFTRHLICFIYYFLIYLFPYFHNWYLISYFHIHHHSYVCCSLIKSKEVCISKLYNSTSKEMDNKKRPNHFARTFVPIR